MLKLKAIGNLVRPNFSKRGKTPWLIAQEDHPNSDLATFIEFINVIDLNNVNRVNSGGQTLPVLPVFFNFCIIHPTIEMIGFLMSFIVNKQ